MNTRLKLSIFLISFSFLLTSCSDKPEQVQQAAPEVTVVKIKPEDTPVVSEYVAKTASSRRVEIRSRVVGFLDKREYEEGTMVDVGLVLFRIDPKPFEARLDAAKAELKQQEARMETAKANLDRIEPLAKQNAVAKKELDDALGRQVAALKDYARLARLNYDEGQVSFIEVLDAERRLFDVELIETQGRNDVYVSLITMYKVIGGGWVVEAEGRVNK